MKKLFRVIIILTLAITTSQLNQVSAHELETNQTVGAVLHMSPEDDPIVGEQTGFFFEFKDKENKFTPEKCNCTFSIEEASIEIYSQNLFQNNASPTLENASAFFTFPKKGIYKIRVEGEPIEKNAFNPFKIEYDVNVQREIVTPTEAPTESSSKSANSKFLYALPISLIIIFISIRIMRKKVSKI